MRLDKLLTELSIGSRSQVKEYIKKGLIKVDGTIQKKPETKVDENSAIITYEGREYTYCLYQYLILNKPAGYITATEDANQKTVMELLPGDLVKGIFPVGRLDKDTEGLLLFTNHGELAHFLLSPKRHVDKTYVVTCEADITENMILQLEKGVDIGEEQMTLPAHCKKISEKVIELTIHEGKFHQVKRMLEAVENKVIHLKRISFGNLNLESIEKEGDYRFLSEEEISDLKSSAGI